MEMKPLKSIASPKYIAKMLKEKSLQVYSIRLSPEMLRRLKKLAKQEKTTVSGLIRQLIMDKTLYEED